MLRIRILLLKYLRGKIMTEFGYETLKFQIPIEYYQCDTLNVKYKTGGAVSLMK